VLDDVRPRNKILISRAFGALTGKQFVVDPNLTLPPSLLEPDPRLFSHPPPKAKRNLQLCVAFGAIDVKVGVLPLTTDGALALKGRNTTKTIRSAKSRTPVTREYASIPTR
jgi:hypothetical protein